MILKIVYNMLLNDAICSITYYENNWVHQVKTLLDSLGFSYNQDTLDEVPYLQIK